MAELFLHIGAPKTGTTAIQHLLSRRRKALAEQGVLYPHAGTMGYGHHKIGAAIFPERHRKLKGERPEPVLAAALPAIREEIAAAAPRRVILSTEFLWGELPKARVLRLLRPLAEHRLHVVAYVRRQDLLAQSIYTQAVKGGAIRSFAEWVEAEGGSTRTGLHFDRVLACWRDCGLPVTTHVRVYERGQIDADVVADFLNTVCPEVVLDDRAEGRGVNTSPDHVTTELLRRISARTGDEAVAEQLRRTILATAAPRGSVAAIDYFAGSSASDFLALFAEGNASIARDYLDREDGVLFRDPLPPDSVGKPITPNAMLDRLVALLPELIMTQLAEPPADEEPVARASTTAAVPTDQLTPEQVERRRERRARRDAAALAR